MFVEIYVTLVSYVGIKFGWSSCKICIQASIIAPYKWLTSIMWENMWTMSLMLIPWYTFIINNKNGLMFYYKLSLNEYHCEGSNEKLWKFKYPMSIWKRNDGLTYIINHSYIYVTL